MFLDDDTEFVMQAREVQYKNFTRLMDLHLEIGYKVNTGRIMFDSLQEKRKDYLVLPESQSYWMLFCLPANKSGECISEA